MNDRAWPSRWVFAVLLGLLIAVPVLASEKVSDATIATWVNEGLLLDPLVKASEVTVEVENGIVTLSGSVSNLAAKNRADLEAKKIRGVRGVINEISVTPTLRSDVDIVSDVRHRLRDDSVVESEGIRVSSAQGKVTLRGEVASGSEAQHAALLASEVRGVAEVNNELVPKYPQQRSDQEIEADAVAALGRDVYLVDLPVTVTVEDGVITLTGSVGSPFEKDRAARDVRWISHVKAVLNELEVRPWENRGARKKEPDSSDRALARAVLDGLQQDGRIRASGLDVRASYGTVTLRGSVRSHAEKRFAENDARDVVGVRWVRNELFAKTDAREDAAIRNDIKFALASDFELEKLDLDPRVEDGVVTMRGVVPNWYDEMHAVEVAGRVRGVRDVVDEMRVPWKTRTSHTHSPSVVEEDIKSNFKWHWATHWIAERIEVHVEEGVATLSGDVDSWAQRKEAGRVAFDTEGVWKVVNRLTVKGYDYEWENWNLQEPYGSYYYWNEYGDWRG